jgi:C4-dicarboxylate transporter, DctQ subunit
MAIGAGVMGLAKKVSWLVDGISVLTGILSALLMGAIAFIVCFEVIMRFVFRNPTGWTIEFVPYLILWGGFIGGSITLKENRHIRVDLLIRILSPISQTIMEAITGAIGILFCSVLFWEGVKMVIQTKAMGTQSSGSLAIPIFIPQLCIPIGAALIWIQFVKRFCQDVYGLKSGEIRSEKIESKGGEPL